MRFAATSFSAFKKMRPNDSVQVFTEKYMENIFNALHNLYSDEELSDVIIRCKEGTLKAHKLILAASSPYFQKIFIENKHDYPIVVMYGISLNQMKHLLDLLYQGTVYVNSSDVEAISNIVKEFEIKGVVFGQNENDNVRIELGGNSSESSHNRDTRFRGQKRVAVDFIQEEGFQGSSGIDIKPTKKELESHTSNYHMKRDTNLSVSALQSNAQMFKEKPRIVEEERDIKSNAWARKQRKFKCDLCPSRSSHLSRHQLVHTGERPYACNQCEKAFSRHDKLKHHVKKNHELIPDSMYERIDLDEINEDSESESSTTYSNAIHNGGNMNNDPQTSSVDFIATSSPQDFERESSPLFTISHITSILEDSFVNPPKKRGRPRKYPIAPPPPQPLVKRGRGRPRIHKTPQSLSVKPNFDITNLPYGDLNYLTSMQEGRRSTVEPESVIIEPIIEINTDQSESERSFDSSQIISKAEVFERRFATEQIQLESRDESERQKHNESLMDTGDVNISEIEAKIGLIGECTISVAN